MLYYNYYETVAIEMECNSVLPTAEMTLVQSSPLTLHWVNVLPCCLLANKLQYIKVAVLWDTNSVKNPVFYKLPN